MKKIYVLGALLLVVVFSFVYFFEMRKDNGSSKTANLNSNILAKGLSFVQSQNGLLLYNSKRYGFTLLVPDTFSQTLVNNDVRYYPGVLETIEFREINKNTNQEKNRETPNGFNTAGDNILTLYINSNSQNLTAQDTDEFQNWYKQAFVGEDIESIDEVFLGGKSILSATVANGVAGAKGRSYFVFSEKNILAIASNDVAKDVMDVIVGSITWPNE